MSDHLEPWHDPEPYWEQDRVNERDEWDLHVRAVADEERDRLTRDEGENGMIHYGMDGQIIDRDKWIELMSGDFEATRRVARDRQGDIEVSTVLLGLDHNYGDGPPLIFETMIFGGEYNEYQERYATREQAEEGHRRVCALAFGEGENG